MFLEAGSMNGNIGILKIQFCTFAVMHVIEMSFHIDKSFCEVHLEKSLFFLKSDHIVKNISENLIEKIECTKQHTCFFL